MDLNALNHNDADAYHALRIQTGVKSGVYSRRIFQ